MSKNVLTVGMATRGEPDHVWFVLQALHANHPKVDYIVVDNTPERDLRVESVTRAVGGTYYHRPDLTGTAAPRDAVFRFATTPWAMCIDAHVILETGAIQAALDYIAAHPRSNDIISGPIIGDDGVWSSSHWRQTTPPGLWGVWDTDPRVHGTEPFEIPMMGLGLWMMRREAWPGFHPLFRGFGGEEGYIHELVRQRGGKAVCLPTLRWRHKFRDTSGWHNNPPPPYPTRKDDHVWNLMIGHREVGIDADDAIRKDIATHINDAGWEVMKAAADAAQPLGGPRTQPKRQRILALWYSDNTAPEHLMRQSAQSVLDAQQQTRGHEVTISAVSWEQIPSALFGNNGIGSSPIGVVWDRFSGERLRSHKTIIAQIKQAVQQASNRFWSSSGDLLSGLPVFSVGEWDAVVFCEHDVLYPPGYFDRIGDALARSPDAPVISHLDYMGLNATGWQRVRERHEPMHQLTLRWNTFWENLARAERDCAAQGWAYLEPDHAADRSAWVRLQPQDPSGMTGTPSVHVNHTQGRFTGHGDVCYEPRGVSLWHPHWGEAKNRWPGMMEVTANIATDQFKGVAPVQTGKCGACEAAKHKTPQVWANAIKAQPSDFHEHVDTVRELAAKCQTATELSLWLKPADAAIASGLPPTGRFISICSNSKPQWVELQRMLGDRFTSKITNPDTVDAIDLTDLLFIDTGHSADVLYPLLERHHEKVGKYIVIHCTETFGENGDKPNSPGVMPALRTFCHKNPHWIVKRRNTNNHGLMVLSKCDEDKKDLPGILRKILNVSGAVGRILANGHKTVPMEVLEERQGTCAVCEERALDTCAACGCPLASKLPLAGEKCPKGKWPTYTEKKAVSNAS